MIGATVVAAAAGSGAALGIGSGRTVVSLIFGVTWIRSLLLIVSGTTASGGSCGTGSGDYTDSLAVAPCGTVIATVVATSSRSASKL